jgi:protein-tyrosine phosphatase
VTAWRAPFPPPSAADLIEDHRDQAQTDATDAAVGTTTPQLTPTPDQFLDTRDQVAVAARWDSPRSAAVPLVLVVCTGNLCRSQMAAAMLANRLGDRALVVSAGTDAAGIPLPRDVVEVMATRGFDLGGIRSRAVNAAMVEHADLVVAMEVGHVARLSAGIPDAFAKTFTLRELVRRAKTSGARGSDESLVEWVRAVHGDRRPADLFSTRGCDEVADPYRRGRAAYERSATELSELTGRLTSLAFPD